MIILALTFAVFVAVDLVMMFLHEAMCRLSHTLQKQRYYLQIVFVAVVADNSHSTQNRIV